MNEANEVKVTDVRKLFGVNFFEIMFRIRNTYSALVVEMKDGRNVPYRWYLAKPFRDLGGTEELCLAALAEFEEASARAVFETPKRA